MFAVARRGAGTLRRVPARVARVDAHLHFARTIGRRDADFHAFLFRRLEHLHQLIARFLAQPVAILVRGVLCRNDNEVIRLVGDRDPPPAIHDFRAVGQIPLLQVCRMRPCQVGARNKKRLAIAAELQPLIVGVGINDERPTDEIIMLQCGNRLGVSIGRCQHRGGIREHMPRCLGILGIGGLACCDLKTHEKEEGCK